MSLLKTYTDEEKRKLKLHMLSSDKHSMSSDAFVLGCRSMTDEIAELREVLDKISRVAQRTPELNDNYTHEDVGILNDRIDEVFGIVETAIAKYK